jgi:peroxiredoxin
MSSTVDKRKEYKIWQEKYDTLAPKISDPAPDFELSDVDGENLVRLSDYRGKKPVALIFGSHT